MNAGSDEQIQELLNSMDRQAKDLKSELIKLVWYMRGGITYAEILMMNSSEREIIGKLIKENLETTKKSGLPFF